MPSAVARDLATRTREIFAAALGAADPAAFTRGALARAFPADEIRQFHHNLWIVALGKAAPAMAREAIVFADRHAVPVAGGLVVAPPPVGTTDPRLRAVAGDHPAPGKHSAHAADELAYLCEEIAGDDLVLLLVSGGTSSLIGAPVEGLGTPAYATLNEVLFGAGLDIARLNRVRMRFSRWGAGRLAAALAPAHVQQVLLSDVPFDRPDVIGSGPCWPDASSAADVEAILRDAGIANRVPLAVAAMLGAVIAGSLPETPKPRSRVFDRVREAVVGGNADALRAAARRATELIGPHARCSDRQLTGDAATAGREIARALLDAEPGTCLVYGGETTVTLPDPHGTGGRNQQLALAAAEVLRVAPGLPLALLAAGTDGVDGPTDAAGAVVSGDTWSAIAAAGIDPTLALSRCDAYPALDAAGALLRTGPTGTNVADLVIALRG